MVANREGSVDFKVSMPLFIYSTNTYRVLNMCDALVSDWVRQWVPTKNALNASPACIVSEV